MTTTTITLRISVVIEPDGDVFHAYCPALKGLHVDGKTQKEARKNAIDAIETYLCSLAKHGDPFPIGSDFTVTREETSFPPRAKLQNLDVQWPLARTCGVS